MKNINDSRCIRKTVSPDFEGTPLIFLEHQSLHHCRKSKGDTDIYNRKKNSSLIFLKSYYELSKQARYNIGHYPFKFISECSFNGKPCSETQMDPFVTFRTYGARILIHDPNEKPNPEEEGFNISPGYEILISMKKIITQRLPAPYKDKCMDYKKRTNGSPVNKNDCVRRCIQEKNFAKCGCIDQTLGVMIHLKSCDATNETQSCCLHDVLTDMGSHGPPCNCPLPCSTFNYKSVLSRSTLPKGNSLIEMTLSDVYDNKCVLKQEKVRVNVYYSSMEEHIYKQHPKWLISEFLGFLGNEFGIWLGLSLMVVFEVIEKLRHPLRLTALPSNSQLAPCLHTFHKSPTLTLQRPAPIAFIVVNPSYTFLLRPPAASYTSPHPHLRSYLRHPHRTKLITIHPPLPLSLSSHTSRRPPAFVIHPPVVLFYFLHLENSAVLLPSALPSTHSSSISHILPPSALPPLLSTPFSPHCRSHCIAVLSSITLSSSPLLVVLLLS
ncbi:Degenerin mec-10 like protein [Argiope bruennichi]|uniref:Degenerin mec-10 like protein n=1 Tax=Argiope bruennichi TaxID=94029 RepID=A0A8T0EYZ4_ARGBR|nr:Degenerin mec-10 like protein [Argiope bruennichi]